MRFKIAPDLFYRFVDLATFKEKGELGETVGNRMVNGMVIHAGENYLETFTKDRGGSCAAMVKVVTEVEEPGIFGIEDVDRFLQVLDRFKNPLTVYLTDVQLVLEQSEPKKKAMLPKTSLEYLGFYDGSNIIKQFKWEGGFPRTSKVVLNTEVAVSAEYLREVVKDIKLVRERVYPLHYDGNYLHIRLGDEKTLVIENTIESSVRFLPEAKASYFKGIISVFSQLSGTVHLYFADSAPLWVRMESENIEGNFIIAPVIGV